MLEIYKYLKLSRFSILGYTSHYERMKDNIISNLNHIIVNEPNKPTIESLIRNDKINQIFNNEINCYLQNTEEYIVVDFMNLKDAFVVRNQSHYLSNVKFKNEQVDGLLKLVGSKYKILITCQMYNSVSVKSPMPKFLCGNDLLYKSDFVFSVGEKIEIIKNRWRQASGTPGNAPLI